MSDQPPYVLATIEQDSRLKEIYRVEPQALERLIDQALFGAFCDHWVAYEQLKRQAMTFVGWDAQRHELRTNSHYESIMIFIDWLLTYASQLQIHQPQREDEQWSSDVQDLDQLSA